MNKGSGLQQGLGLALRLGTEMVAATMIGVLMGYAADHFFNTRPWGILAGVVFGGAAGCLSVYRTAMGLQVDEDKNNGDQTPKGEGL
ncbi:MAG: AtpZ/AtpI family protein [Nitrospinae bacterium]|nr:AtpZ/AtpI family protein [Nitrospinota bacterium]